MAAFAQDWVSVTVVLETHAGALTHDGRFPQRLRRQRIFLGLTQKQLAKRAKLVKTGHRSIEDWENSRSTPRVGGPILRVAEVLGVSVQWLMWGEEGPPDE